MSQQIECIVIDTLNGIQDKQYSAEKQKPNFDKWRDYGIGVYNHIKHLQLRGFEIFLILGYEGSGKSYAMKNLPEGSCIWYNADGKNPTWKGGREIFGTKNSPTTYQVLPNDYPDIINDLDKRGKTAFAPIRVAFILGHIEDYKSGYETRQRLKLLGNLARNMSIEGLMENVLYSEVNVEGNERKYYFRTKNSGMDTCRTIEGLFDGKERIPNDFKYILDKLKAY